MFYQFLVLKRKFMPSAEQRRNCQSNHFSSDCHIIRINLLFAVVFRPFSWEPRKILALYVLEMETMKIQKYKMNLYI